MLLNLKRMFNYWVLGACIHWGKINFIAMIIVLIHTSSFFWRRLFFSICFQVSDAESDHELELFASLVISEFIERLVGFSWGCETIASLLFWVPFVRMLMVFWLPHLLLHSRLRKLSVLILRAFFWAVTTTLEYSIMLGWLELFFSTCIN